MNASHCNVLFIVPTDMWTQMIQPKSTYNSHMNLNHSSEGGHTRLFLLKMGSYRQDTKQSVLKDG